MTAIQFSLFFVALLVGYILLHLRMVRFERYLKHVEGLSSLDDRVGSLGKDVNDLSLERVEEGLHTLHQDLERVVQALGRVERAAVRAGEERQASQRAPQRDSQVSQGRLTQGRVELGAAERDAVVGASSEGDHRAQDQVQIAVVNRLRALGYQDPVLVPVARGSVEQESGPNDSSHPAPPGEGAGIGAAAEGLAEGEEQIVVECVRGGMLCKGRVTLRDGVVVDLDLHPVSQGFP